MFIQGLTNPEHVIELFLNKEYAFSVSYKDGIEIRAAHHKGFWYIARIKDGKMLLLIEYGDNNDVVCSDPLAKAMAESIRDLKLSQGAEKRWRIEEREFCGFIISTFLGVIGGKKDDIEKIEVVQPGRNAYIDENTGDFCLSPRPEEWGK